MPYFTDEMDASDEEEIGMDFLLSKDTDKVVIC